MVLAIAVLDAICTYGEKYLTTSVSQWVSYDLRLTIYSHVQRLSLAFHDQKRTGRSHQPGDGRYRGDPELHHAYKPLLDAGVKFYASLGNHDDPEIERLYKGFNMGGERYYTLHAP